MKYFNIYIGSINMNNKKVNNDQVHDLVRRYQSSGRALLYAIAGASDVEEYSDGCWILGASGKQYLDMGSYAVFLLGHRHPKVVSAVINQIQNLPGSSRAFPSVVNAKACEAIAAISPPGLSKVLLLNSGAEAVEAAVKLARAKTGRAGIVYLEGAYHGKTFGALSITDSKIFRDPFMPLLSETYQISRSDAESGVKIIRETGPAAVFIEPIQGEGGIFEIEFDFLRSIREACNDVGSILIFDEIQCGLGRSGSMWAASASGVIPDILLLGKSLGGGIVPVSAVVAKTEIFEPFDRDPIIHSSTFGGNPIASAAVLATIKVIETDNIPEKARIVGAEVRNSLHELLDKYPHLFKLVTGRGLMQGLHCKRADIAGTFIKSCLNQGILATPCLTHPHVVRFTPPAVMNHHDIIFAKHALIKAALEADSELKLEEENICQI